MVVIVLLLHTKTKKEALCASFLVLYIDEEYKQIKNVIAVYRL